MRLRNGRVWVLISGLGLTSMWLLCTHEFLSLIVVCAIALKLRFKGERNAIR